MDSDFQALHLVVWLGELRQVQELAGVRFVACLLACLIFVSLRIGIGGVGSADGATIKDGFDDHTFVVLIDQAARDQVRFLGMQFDERVEYFFEHRWQVLLRHLVLDSHLLVESLRLLNTFLFPLVLFLLVVGG